PHARGASDGPRAAGRGEPHDAAGRSFVGSERRGPWVVRTERRPTERTSGTAQLRLQYCESVRVTLPSAA
ncbi:MAG: hypothetical protein KC619_11985, partial [Myxococcales bacterium]|nr:hypothetical protein [Myxococcales bacterium]